MTVMRYSNVSGFHAVRSAERSCHLIFSTPGEDTVCTGSGGHTRYSTADITTQVPMLYHECSRPNAETTLVMTSGPTANPKVPIAEKSAMPTRRRSLEAAAAMAAACG